MILNILKFCLNYVWEKLDLLPPHIKTYIFISLISICIGWGVLYIQDLRFKFYSQLSKEMYLIEERELEEYTLRMSDYINTALLEIAERDGETYDVVLLQYHNTKKTLQGLSYIYLDCYTEYKSEPSRISAKKFFKDLDYVTYLDELQTIYQSSFVRCNSMEEFKNKFPRLYYDAFRYLDNKALAIYPLKGVHGYLGMIVLLYDKPRKYYDGYTEKVITPSAELLCAILDYNNVSRK